MSFNLTNTTKNTLPTHPYEAMKDFVLGSDYELSLVIVSEEKMKALNREYRKIDTTTDILSFPLSETSGEIFVCLEDAKKEAKKFDRDYDNFIGFLFIHGLVHLKGLDHGSTMESNEKNVRDVFGV